MVPDRNAGEQRLPPWAGARGEIGASVWRVRFSPPLRPGNRHLPGLCAGHPDHRRQGGALRHVSSATVMRRQYWVLDVDIRKDFDSIPHRELRAILDRRVTDGYAT
jgi:hypothetical protein